MPERRKAARGLTWKTEKLAVAGGIVRDIACAILDVSHSVACLLVPERTIVPAAFHLIIDGSTRVISAN